MYTYIYKLVLKFLVENYISLWYRSYTRATVVLTPRLSEHRIKCKSSECSTHCTYSILTDSTP